MSKNYSVCCWGSHPDLGNDDCWSGEDFATLVDAEQAFARESDDLDVTHVELDGPNINRVRKLRDAPPIDDGDWIREIAQEAGMLGGCDAYNDVMGWS